MVRQTVFPFLVFRFWYATIANESPAVAPSMPSVHGLLKSNLFVPRSQRSSYVALKTE